MDTTKVATFQDWLSEVDNHLERQMGVGHVCLPDAPWRDWYEDGLDPLEATLEYADGEWFF